MLFNILLNGAQTMQTTETGTPRFIIRIYKKETPEMVCVEIVDNGLDMDKTRKSKVFDPFFQRNLLASEPALDFLYRIL